MGTKYNVDNAGIVTLTNDLVVDTNVLKVDTTTNRVGINKTTPATDLDVVGAIAATTSVSSDSLIVTNNGRFGTISIGAAGADASSLVDLISTTKGFLPPRMTQAQRDAITSPATGLLIYQTDNTPGYRVYPAGGPWTIIAGGGGGSFTELRQTFTATGGQTLFTLSTAYTLGNLNLKVYRNGQLQNPGVGNDYTETSTTSFTMLNAQTAGDIVSAVYVVPSVALLTPTVGTENRQAFTSTGSPQQFTLSSAYLNNGTNLRVFVNGSLQKPSTNYSEDNTTQFTFTTGLTSGDIVEAIWVTAAVGIISYTPSTEVRQDFVATGAEAGLFTLTGGATFTQGGANLKVYVGGTLMRLGAGNDYTEPSNSSVQFNIGNYPLVGEVVSLLAITQTGALGSFQNRRDEFVSTASQTLFNATFTFVMGGADLLVYNDGVLMKLGEDYYELNNTQVVFFVGRTLNSKVTLVAKIQAAAGDANSVNGISASITPTAGKLVPLDGNAQFSANVNVYAILAAL